jgi:hypothetical protein
MAPSRWWTWMEVDEIQRPAPGGSLDHGPGGIVGRSDARPEGGLSTNFSTTVERGRHGVENRARPRGQRRSGADREAVEPEETDVVARRAVDGEVGHDLADDAGELVPVPAARGSDAHLRRPRQYVDREVLVR